MLNSIVVTKNKKNKREKDSCMIVHAQPYRRKD